MDAPLDLVHRTEPAAQAAPARLWLPHWSLSRCVRAVVARNNLGIGRHWPEAWHYNHFPASPLCSVGWVLSGHTDLLAPGAPAAAHSPGERLPPVYFAGPFTRPTLSRNAPEGQGLLLMLMPDAAQALTGLDPAQWLNRCQPISALPDPAWQALGEAVQQAPDDEARLGLIEAFLIPRWQALRADAGAPGQRLGDWAQGLAQRAAHSGVGRSLRQMERRIKGWTGLPLRELRGFGRAEQAFFRALAEDDGAAITPHPRPPDWAGLAVETGYADQSHLCREVRRITGFSPAELRRRIATDECFWLYRLWINSCPMRSPASRKARQVEPWASAMQPRA